MKKLLATLPLLMCLVLCAQQRKLDSIQSLLKKNPADTQRVNLLLAENSAFSKMGQSVDASHSLNEALTLAHKIKFIKGELRARSKVGFACELRGNYKEAMQHYNTCLQICLDSKDIKNEANMHNSLGNCYLYQGIYGEAMKEYQLELDLAMKMKNPDFIELAHTNMGGVHAMKGEYAEALKDFLFTLKLAEETGNKKEMSHSFGTIGNIYYYQNNLNQALSYYQKAIALMIELDLSESMGPIYTNMGVINRQLNRPDEALRNYLDALRLSRETGDKKGEADTYQHLGVLYGHLKKYPEGLSYFKQALNFYTELNDREGLATAYVELGGMYSEQGKASESIESCTKALPLAIAVDDRQTQKNCYKCLALAYAQQKSFEKAYINYTLSAQLNDTLINTDNNKQMAQMNALYQSEKKDKELQLNSIEIKKRKAESEKQESQRKVFVIGIILVAALALFILTFALFLLKNSRQRQKAHRIISMQKALVEEKNKDITDSINYAKRIQEAILPANELRKRLFPESFILFKPKDIVSGDFYWFSEKNGMKIIAAADCTGHGVPGAFMSMIGNAFLNEIVNERGITSPSEILNRLREMIISSLKQGDGANKDGMDICLVALDQSNRKGEYAGANNPLWKCSVTDGQAVMTEFKADKQPVGLYTGETNKFSSQTFELGEGDMLYLFTDGFADQFGGEKGKKFKYKPLQEKLLSISGIPMEGQHEELLRTFTAWKGNLEQVDDMLVIGIRA
jgi:tetratricopeptide (TPR) repeat protein